MGCSLPGSSVHGIFQARILEWVAISFSRRIFPTQGSNLGLLHCRQMLYHLSHQGSQLTWFGHGLFQNGCLVSCVANTSSLPRDRLQIQTQLNSTSRSFFPFKSVMTPSGCRMLFLRQAWAVNFFGSPAYWERCVWWLPMHQAPQFPGAGLHSASGMWSLQ